jgi:hypothetical protein
LNSHLKFSIPRVGVVLVLSFRRFEWLGCRDSLKRMVLEVGVGVGSYHSSYFQKHYKPKAIDLFYITMAKDTTKGRAQDNSKPEDYSKIGIEALSRNLTKSRSIVSLKFKAEADFFAQTTQEENGFLQLGWKEEGRLLL